MTETIINLQALLVKSYLLNALLINRKAFPIGYHGAQVLRQASRYSARLNAVRRDCLLWGSPRSAQDGRARGPHRAGLRHRCRCHQAAGALVDRLSARAVGAGSPAWNELDCRY